MIRFTPEQVGKLNDSVRTAEDALRWASENLHPKVAKASSFGAEDAVIMDIMMKINPEFRLFTLDTGRRMDSGPCLDFNRLCIKLDHADLLISESANPREQIRDIAPARGAGKGSDGVREV